MKYADLRDFIAQLERMGELRRIGVPLSPRHEVTELADRVLRAQGPALLIERPHHAGRDYKIPLLANLFGTPRRVALGMGEDSVEALREVGALLAFLKEPEPPRGLKDAFPDRILGTPISEGALDALFRRVKPRFEDEAAAILARLRRG